MEDLKSPEPYTRQQAKRVLAEKDPTEVFTAVQTYLAGLSANDPLVEHQKLEALWVCESIDHVNHELLEQLLQSPEPRVRAAAVRVLGHWHEELPDGPKLLAKAISDDFPRVRLEAIHAISLYPSAESESIALQALDKPRDKFIDYALWLATNDLKPQWQPALEKGDLQLPPMHEAFALQSINSPQALRPLLAEFARGHMADDDRTEFMNLLITAGSAADCQAALDLAIGDKLSAPHRVELLNALSQAPAIKSVPQDSLAKASQLIGDNEAVSVAALRLAGAAQVQSLRPAIMQLAASEVPSLPVRKAAITAIGALGGKPSIHALESLTNEKQPIELRFAAVEALVPLDLKAAAEKAVDALSSSGAANPTELFNAFLQHTDGDKSLAAALQNHKISPDAAKLGMRAIYQASRNDSPLLTALPTAGGIDAAPPPLTHEQMAKLMAEVSATGSPARGEQIFRRKELNCMQCHAIAGTGGNVAPDLLSLGASAPLDYIIDSVLLPNKVVKEGFNSLIITTKDGRQITGIVVRHSATELVLRDATHDEIPIAVANIKSSRDGGSIMPSGLTEMLTQNEFVDLIRFLSELGKGQYAAAGMPVARRWRLLYPPIAGTSASPAELNDNPSLTWIPMYAQVNGVLPIDPTMPGRNYLRTQFEVTTAGKIELSLNDPHTAVLAWMDNALIEPKNKMTFDLGAGVHTLSLLIEAPRCRNGLKLELSEITGSSAKAQFSGGK
jgi:putative heme-binding domain-containing protein